MKQQKNSKISDIEKIIKCSCDKGTIKLITIFVDPMSGRVSLSYRYCTNSLCSHNWGLLMFTDIIIPQLILGEIVNDRKLQFN